MSAYAGYSRRGRNADEILHLLTTLSSMSCYWRLAKAVTTNAAPPMAPPPVFVTCGGTVDPNEEGDDDIEVVHIHNDDAYRIRRPLPHRHRCPARSPCRELAF